MDTERYCEETQPHDADCEDNFAKTGITVLLVYQATQMLSLWSDHAALNSHNRHRWSDTPLSSGRRGACS